MVGNLAVEKEKVKEKQGSLGKRRAKTQSKSERNVLGVFAVLFLRVAPFARARGKRRTDSSSPFPLGRSGNYFLPKG